MKKYFLLLTFAALFQSCNKKDELLTFRFDSSVDFTVPSAAGVNLPVSIPTPDVQSGAQQSFQNNNTRADLVKNVVLEEIELSITNPPGQDFGFLKEVHLFISASGLPEREIAYATNIPENAGTKLALETTDVALDEYVKQSTYDIRTEVVIREAFFQDVDITADMVFRVTADIL
ncbi:hypothetical protein QWY31_14630 [Cytophagales bacterium LB-30]|uniref:Uncharacterized protein n=1 Tax=Shiella aurantiaca TaxID=3058365 RepID=A0ABT8F8P0_9BACT|nr:hypothetical protein [Shiella aurantiaca]MDN4166744.1 hypothetical protein [Shiella aurantiaca]